MQMTTGKATKLLLGEASTVSPSESVDVLRDAAAFGGAEHKSLVDLSKSSSLRLELCDLLDHLRRGQLEITDVRGGCRENGINTISI